MDTAADSERTPTTGGTELPGTRCAAGPPATEPPDGNGSTSGEAAELRVTGSDAKPGPGVASRPASSPAALVFDDPLDRPSADDTDRGWGELPSASADDDFTRFLSEKPPHHL